jgi:hypothetical protein
MRTIKTRRMNWAGRISRVVPLRNAYKILVGKHEGKREIGRSVFVGGRVG